MNIKIITVGKLKEKYLKEGIAEYTKRLGSYCKLQIIEVGDEKAPENLSDKEMEIIKDKEGEKILAKIPEQSYVFAMAIQGKQYDSVEFANEIDKLGTSGKSDIVFIIGGSLGLSQAVLSRANQHISFGKLTYPHQLMRLVLVEQIYRAFRIIHGHAYHK
ncbi:MULTISPECIES: 23S rRNA (pseudouridine(1915)-N(3))-methyltransferase RlmH [Trichococcus]|uniref:Ribosomal RNA large subunit methyltransferase H n=1 Tax=Trichococcus collinsii TaxID=157076 RepID=A0AB38A297_9LACT|nr:MULTISPECIES: 23S rRNA (pseudouridine(1915)-N(3))-methyltransferase RlmH [Trichococcus]OUL08383.1 23S rRNA (pseudouridine(1915)-N(3))-methyltransferase RlmH [Sedimentibacter sp. SX930]CZR05344.1 alpha/beta knot methyltransferases [Trichococcus collinsii]SEA75667.1 23S rRNA (pseudouridine1915-N3)-methyltransferase [Trichococcus collinsii]